MANPVHLKCVYDPKTATPPELDALPYDILNMIWTQLEDSRESQSAYIGVNRRLHFHGTRVLVEKELDVIKIFTQHVLQRFEEARKNKYAVSREPTALEAERQLKEISIPLPPGQWVETGACMSHILEVQRTLIHILQVFPSTFLEDLRTSLQPSAPEMNPSAKDKMIASFCIQNIFSLSRIARELNDYKTDTRSEIYKNPHLTNFVDAVQRLIDLPRSDINRNFALQFIAPMLEEAVELIQKSHSEDFKAASLKGVSEIFETLKNIDEAIRIGRLIPANAPLYWKSPDKLKTKHFEDMFQRLVNKGKFEDARRVLEGIPDGEDRSNILNKTFTDFINKQQFDKAVIIAKMVADRFKQGCLLTEVCNSFLEEDFVDNTFLERAFGSAAEIQLDMQRDLAYLSICKHCCQRWIDFNCTTPQHLTMALLCPESILNPNLQREAQDCIDAMCKLSEWRQ